MAPSAQHFQSLFNCHWGDCSLAEFIYSWFALNCNTHNENFPFQANFDPIQRRYSEDISPVIRHFQSKSSQFEARVGEADEASSRNSHCSSYLACGERLNRNRLPKGEETWGNRRLWFPWLTALLHMPELCLLWWHLQSYKIQSSQGRQGGWSIGEVTGVKKSRCWEKRPSYKKQSLDICFTECTKFYCQVIFYHNFLLFNSKHVRHFQEYTEFCLWRQLYLLSPGGERFEVDRLGWACGTWRLDLQQITLGNQSLVIIVY